MMTLPSRSITGRLNLTVVVFVAVMAGIAITGGSSRVDSLGQIGARISGIVVIAALMIAKRQVGCAIAVQFTLALTATIAVQLIPLPPSWWQHLDSRSLFASGDQALLLSVWRPLSISPDLTLDALLSIIPVISTVVAFGALRRDGLFIVVPTICAIIGGSALLGVAQIAGGPSSSLRYYELHGDGAVGLFANRNHAGLLLALGLPALAPWFELQRGVGNAVVRVLFFVGVAVILMIVLLLNGSRAGLTLGLLGGLVAAAMLLWNRQNWPIRRLGRWSVAAAAVVILIGGTTVALRPTVLARFIDIGVADDLRGALAPLLRQMAVDYFPFGSGFGTFPVAYRIYEPFALLRIEYVNAAHNDWAQLLIESGLAGGLLLVAFLIWWMRATIRLGTDSGIAGRGSLTADDLMAWLGWTITAFVMLASIVDYPMRTPLIASLFALGCCMMLSRRERARNAVARYRALPDT
jgi:hypothetical protein